MAAERLLSLAGCTALFGRRAGHAVQACPGGRPDEAGRLWITFRAWLWTTQVVRDEQLPGVRTHAIEVAGEMSTEMRDEQLPAAVMKNYRGESPISELTHCHNECFRNIGVKPLYFLSFFLTCSSTAQLHRPARPCHRCAASWGAPPPAGSIPPRPYGPTRHPPRGKAPRPTASPQTRPTKRR